MEALDFPQNDVHEIITLLETLQMTRTTSNQSAQSPDASSNNVTGLLFGANWHWNGDITYAFPDADGDYGNNYPNWFYTDSNNQGQTRDLTAVMQQLQANGIQSATSALDKDDGNAFNNGLSIEGFTSMGVSAGGQGSANIRIAATDLSGISGGLGNPPSSSSSVYQPVWITDGDIWMPDTYQTRDMTPGGAAYATLLHEIGHAMGLKHTHDQGGGNNPILTDEYDSTNWTVMTYHHSTTTSNNPQSFMIGDIAALQHYYGANYNTANGDNVYSWSPTSGDTLNNGNVMLDSLANKIQIAIWDGGGKDTYDLSAYSTTVEIDLRPGTYTINSASQTNNTHHTVPQYGNVYNALMVNGNTASLIENAIGGSGNDELWGNQTANKLHGGAGTDYLSGANGSDNLAGQAGQDTMRGGNGNDTYWGGSALDSLSDTFIIEKGNDVIKDFQNGIDMILLGGDFSSNYTTLYNNSTQSGGNLTLYGANGSTLVIEGFTKAMFTADDIAALIPGVFDDTSDHVLMA